MGLGDFKVVNAVCVEIIVVSELACRQHGDDAGLTGLKAGVGRGKTQLIDIMGDGRAIPILSSMTKLQTHERLLLLLLYLPSPCVRNVINLRGKQNIGFKYLLSDLIHLLLQVVDIEV